METGEELQWMEKGKCTNLQKRLRVQYRELQAHQPLFALLEKDRGNPLEAYICTNGGGDWEPSAWTGSERNLFPCANSREVEWVAWKRCGKTADKPIWDF